MTDDNVQSKPNADDASSQPAGESAPSQPIAASSPPAKKPRSVIIWPRFPGERLIFWGVIGVLLLVAAVEGNARYGYKWTLSALAEAIEKDKQGEPTSFAQLDGLLKGFVTRSDITKEGSSYVIECQWKSMFNDYTIKIYVTEEDPQEAYLSSYTTPDPEPEPVRTTPAADDGDEEEGEEPADGEIADREGDGTPPVKAESTAAKEE